MNLLSKTTLLALFVATVLLNSEVGAAPSKIGILVFDGFLTSDVTVPIEVFGAATKKEWFAGYEVVVISATKNRQVVSEEGLKLVADMTIYDEVALEVFIVPSAYEMDVFLQDKNLLDYIEKQAQSAAWLASNCSGAFLLAAAGVLDGKRATTWAGGESGLQEAYPKIKVQVDENVVVDEGVITSNGGAVSYQAAFALLGELSTAERAKEISASTQFNRLARAFKTQ